MDFEQFIQQAQGLAVIDTRVLPRGKKDSPSLKVQINRWVKSGKLIQLKRGLYLLAGPYRKISPSEFYIAGILKNPSYISLEKALEYHGLIPEAVSVVTCVTTKRPALFTNSQGRYDYRHVKPSLFWGYKALTLNGQTAFMATPEKALLDFFYLRAPEVSMNYLSGLRLQNTGIIRVSVLTQCARRFNKKKLLQAAELIRRYIKEQR